MEHLLRECGETLVAIPRAGSGVDRTTIRALLALTPAGRLASLPAEAATLDRLDRGASHRRAMTYDPLRALRTLQEHGVRFLLIGGVAGRLWGSPSLTNDTDICYATDPDNLEQLAHALRALDARLRGVDDDLQFALDPTTLASGQAFTFTTSAGALDLLAMPAGTNGFDELMANAEPFDLGEGLVVTVCSLDDLIRMKRAGRKAQGPHRARSAHRRARGARRHRVTAARDRGQTVAMREAIAGRLVGTKVARVEDPRLLTGTGRYVDDITVPGMLHAHFVRSPFAHAVIRGIDVDAARRLPGVVAVYTGADMEALTHPFMGFLPLPDLYHPVYFALAVDRVRVVGDPVALIIADTRYVAEDAAQLVVVDYEELEPIATIEHALDPSRPALWPAPEGNVLQRDAAEYGDVDAAFAGADRVVRAKFVQHRYSNQPMETRGCVAEVDPVAGTVQYHAATQNTHLMKWSLAALTGRRTVWAVAGRDRAPARPAGRPAAEGEGDGRGEQGRGAADAGAEARTLLEEPSVKACRRRSHRARSMAQTFLREPIRIVYLARMLLGLLARDPVTLPARHRPGHRRRVRRQGAPDPRRRRGARGRGRPRTFGEVDRGPQRAPADRGTGARGDARRRGGGARRRHAARVARAHDDGPGRVPALPVQRGDVPAA